MSGFGDDPLGEPFLAAVSVATTPSTTGTTGTLDLPDQFVAGDQIIGLTPTTLTVTPGAPAAYMVNLSNPTNNAVIYALSVQGVPAPWVGLNASVTIAANGTASVPLTLTSEPFAAVGSDGFSVSVSGNNGASGSVLGNLVLQGQPVPPDPESHGIVVALTPAQASAGQATPANYVVQLTNTGSADDTFTLSTAGLPAGGTARFAHTSLDVPPGVSNLRDVPLVVTVPQGTRPGSYPFTVTATSTSAPTATSTTNGMLVVSADGVKVSLDPSSGAPGTGFQETVTNTGTVADTYTLELAGPGALVSSLGTKQVTLAPGASRIVPISTGAVNFAVQGDLNLMAMATSTANPAVQAAATAALSIPATVGMTASFSPSSQPLAKPGPGFVPADSPEHRQHRGLLHGDDHRHQRTGHGQSCRPGRLTHAVHSHLQITRTVRGGDPGADYPLGVWAGDGDGSGHVVEPRRHHVDGGRNSERYFSRERYSGRPTDSRGRAGDHFTSTLRHSPHADDPCCPFQPDTRPGTGPGRA